MIKIVREIEDQSYKLRNLHDITVEMVNKYILLSRDDIDVFISEYTDLYETIFKKLAKKYRVDISHIETCLESYVNETYN